MERTKVVGYIRVSTKEQGDGGVSLEAQRAKIQTYAEIFDIDLVGIEVDVASGKSMKRRKGLKKCLQMMEEGEADGLLIVKLDRLSRRVRDMFTLIEDVFQDKVLISVTDKIDTSSASGRLVLGILTQLSQWEREIIGERTSEALQHLRRQEVKLGRSGLGFRHTEEVDGEGRRVIVRDTQEQETISVIVNLRKEGRTLQAIADHLQDQGFPTKRGGRWTGKTVQRIFNREMRARTKVAA